MSNTLRIEGRLIELAPMRYTPAGVPLINCILGHASRQVENGLERDVECELPAVAIGDMARQLAVAACGWKLEATGFLAAKSKRSKLPVLHITNIKFLEGIDNGFQTQES
ncbi:primosomal replication protein N [Nitrogeniibacter aestuarii]|uniref:primosomal replication protein N n=1 Tax=Nitrogeniibacter aestuarii TaxID=2815343 RepID=UPI001D0F7ADE|nr:primosomal replication protein N [Nitrogeniibacter aestuarii]